jgi:NADH-quinone oxidoreductase subunit D
VSYIEVLSGTRLHAVSSLISRLRYDITLFFIDSFIFWLSYYIRKLKEVHSVLSINRLWRTRLYEIGIVIKDSCLYYGSSGLLSRPIRIIIDARLTGHEFHEELNYPIPYPLIGDCLDRYIPRINEIIESCRIIYACFFQLLYLVIWDNGLNNNGLFLGDEISILRNGFCFKSDYCWM